MDTTKLSRAYFDKQLQRIGSSIEKIVSRVSPTSTGRVIPDRGDLPIGAGRRLEASVLFLDICGFSNCPSDTQAEQELLLRIITFFFSEIIRIVEDYEGTVEKNTGDGLMAYFTKDSDGGRSAQELALSSALTTFYTAECLLNPMLRHYGIPPIEFRICIDHGHITVANVGAAKRFNGIVAIGATANIACKMLSVAERGTILLGSMVLPGLPASWSGFIRLKSNQTGWVYRSGQPYCFYEYVGRWSEPKL